LRPAAIVISFSFARDLRQHVDIDSLARPSLHMQLTSLTLTGRALPQLHSRCARVCAGFASTMKTDKGKTVKKENLPSKTCAVCGRPFTWCVDPACHASLSKRQAFVLTVLCCIGVNAKYFQRPDDDLAWFQEEEVGELLGRREVSLDRNCVFKL
jgi:hypothetical protein